MINRNVSSLTLLLFFVALVECVQAEQRELLLIDEQSIYAIVIGSTEGGRDEDLAIQELNSHIVKMSGKPFPVSLVKPTDLAAELKRARDDRRIAIVIGSLALDGDATAAIHAVGTDPASFALLINDQTVRIAGLSAAGTLNGVYALLEQLGCRWYMPGEFGTVVPKVPVVKVRVQQSVEVPSFQGRSLQMLEGQTDWYRRMRLGGAPVPGAHGINIGGAKLADHPEFYALFEGKRVQSQLCISNPEVLRLAVEQTRKHFRDNPGSDIIGMGPSDGREFCECDRCRALDGGDWDPFAKMESITDRYVWFFNAVLDAISDEFPDKSLSFYAYDGTMRPPVKVKPNPRIIPTFALIRVCHIHGMSNPICPERGYYQTLLRQWSGLVTQSFDRDYLLNYNGYPISHVDRSRDELPLLRKLGVTRIRRQTWPCWGNMTPSIYITAKLLWNANADVDALEQDFYDRFFGPASVPMSRYFKRLDAAYRDADTHPRWENVDMAVVMPAKLIELGGKDLAEASAVASEEQFAKRVAAFQLMHESLAVYLATIDAQDRFDFASARENVSRLVELQNQAMRHVPQLMSEPTTRMLQQSIEDAYGKTTGNGRLLAGVPSRWSFLIDPAKVGEDLKFWDKNLQGGNWDSRSVSSIALKAIVSDWDQDLRWYSGEAWYRTSVKIPTAVADSDKVVLWLRRIPKGSKVWLNGRLIGEADGTLGYQRPYELDVSDSVVHDAENVIAIRATGPVHGPVMFYASRSSGSDK